MPKININGKNNWLQPSGNQDFNLARLDQYVLSSSNVNFNALSILTDVTIGNDLTINGSLLVKGSTTVINTTVTQIKDNIVLINSAEIGAGLTSHLSGIEVDRGSLKNYQFVFEEATQFFKVGQLESLQCVATREDNPLSYGAMIFNPTSQRIDSTQSFPLQMFFNSTNNSTSSTTGSVVVNGGIGAKGNIYTDGLMAFQGSTNHYYNYINSNTNDDFNVTVGRNLNFQVSSGNNIIIPANVNTNIGSGSIFSDNTSLTIQNTNKIILNSSTNVQIPSNTFLSWGTNTANSIVYDGTKLNINASSQTSINSITHISIVNSSTSPSTGSLISLGGIGINNSTNSSSSVNGGSLSVLGGVGIQGDTYIGSSLIVADKPLVGTQVSNQGINFRSLNRTFSTNTNNDIIFNSFEGGSINASGVIINNASTVYIDASPSITSNSILYNSYALYIASGNVFMGNSSLTIGGTTPTTSYTTGTFLLSGGLAINLAQNAVSVTNGGSFGTAGGVAVGMDGYFGGKLDIGNTDKTLTQNSNEGINFISRSRIITTTNTSDLAFNSFEGGIIHSSVNITNSSTIYIKNSPTITGGGVLSNIYSLWIASGISRFDDKLIVNNTTVSSNSTTGSVVLSGGLSISNTTDATNSISGGSITVGGGIASAKTIYAGTGFYSVNGIGSHFTLQNADKNRFSFNLANAESTSNIGSDFTINRYDDTGALIDYPLIIKRSTGIITITGTTSSSSNSLGQLQLNGGISISNTTNATDYTNGGTLTSAGGFAFAKDGYIYGNFYLNGSLNATTGTTNLGKVVVNSDFTIAGTTNVIDIHGSSLTTNTTNISLNATNSTTITSSTISLNSTGNSNFVVNSGTLSLSSVGMTINGGTGTLTIQNSGTMNINSGNSPLNFISLNSVNIGTTGSGVPVIIGDALSTTTLSGNLTIGGNLTINGLTTTINSTIVSIADIAFVVNNRPTGISDGGFLIHRYQTPNDIGEGQVVGDTAKVTSTFDIGCALPGTLVLNSSSSTLDNFYNGWWIKITGSGQVRRISTYIGATRTATLYTTANTDENSDGLDLTTLPSAGDAYSLYDIPYASIYYSAPNRELRFAGVPFQQHSGVFGTPSTYLKLHCQTLVLEEELTLNSHLKVLLTDAQAFVVGQTNATTTSNFNFIVDTLNGNISVANTVSTLNSTTGINFNQLNNTNSVQTYSSIHSQIINNASVTGNLLLNTTIAGTSTNLMLLNGSTSTVDITSPLKILNTTSTTTTSSGALISSGGVCILNPTDAISFTSGGSFFTAGGASITKRLYIGGKISSSDTTKAATTSNTLNDAFGSMNINGDLVLYNSTNQTILFNSAGINSPTYSSRSLGTKIVYNPNISGSSCDYATGIATNSLWNSVPTAASSFDFYFGTSNYTTLNSTGIKFNQSNIGITFVDNSKIYLNSTTGNVNFVPVNNFSFRNTADTANNITISNNGMLSLGLSNISVTPSSIGSIFNIRTVTFTDTNTNGSGTATNFVINSIGQSILSASNLSVTTSSAISSYFGGALISGTNENIINNYNIYIAKGASIGNTASAYSLYIQDAPIVTSGNTYALYVDGTGKNYINGLLTIGNTTNVTDNTISSVSGSLNSGGDIVLYNSTKQTIYFNSVGSGIPAITTRSVGTKIVLLPNITSGTTDYALGISNSSLWYSVSDTTCNHSWYLGTSNRLMLDNSGLTFTANGSRIVYQKMSDDISIMAICGGTGTTGTDARIVLQGTGALELSSSITEFYNSGNLSMTISEVGDIILASLTDSTGAGDGSFYTPGGMQIDQTLYVGSGLVLNFNQPYTFIGDTSGRLNITSGTTGLANRIRHFTFDKNNTTDNVNEFYGFYTTIDSEYLSIGYLSSNYTITTKATGSGTLRPLVLQTGSNTNQVILNANGSVNINTGTLTTQKISISDTTVASTGVGSFVTAGGAYISQNLIVNTNLQVNGTINAGVATSSITVSSLVNLTSVTPQNIKTITNGGEVIMSCAFTFTPTTTNTKSSFIITLPFIVTSIVNLYDIILTSSGFYNDGTGEYIDIENLRAYPIVGTATAKVVFTSGNIASQEHTLMLIARYKAQ